MRKYKYFPLVGILASKGKKNNTFRGELAYFKSIQKELMSFGGLSFVFRTDDVHEDYVNGFVYYETKEKWGKISFPFPDLIYNRVALRKEELTPPFLTLFHSYTQQNKPFFNPSFFNKWDSYQALSKSKRLVPYLPETWMYTTITDLLSKLNIYHSLFLKPVNGHKGKNIHQLTFEDGQYFIRSNSNISKYTYDEFMLFFGKHWEQNQYLIQKAIKTDTIDECKFDLRILCIYENGSHKISGIGVRKAAKNSIITHIPNGGSIVSFQEVKHKCSPLQLNWLAETVGAELAKFYGFIGEFSMDIGLTPKGNPFIFEVNSKPMIFDENTIQTNRITRLVELFNELANTTNTYKKDF